MPLAARSPSHEAWWASPAAAHDGHRRMCAHRQYDGPPRHEVVLVVVLGQAAVGALQAAHRDGVGTEPVLPVVAQGSERDGGEPGFPGLDGLIDGRHRTVCPRRNSSASARKLVAHVAQRRDDRTDGAGERDGRLLPGVARDQGHVALARSRGPTSTRTGTPFSSTRPSGARSRCRFGRRVGPGGRAR